MQCCACYHALSHCDSMSENPWHDVNVFWKQFFLCGKYASAKTQPNTAVCVIHLCYDIPLAQEAPNVQSASWRGKFQSFDAKHAAW